MFVINLRKSFLFMQGYKNCWKCYTIYTMIYKKWQIEVNGEKWYVEKKIVITLFCFVLILRTKWNLSGCVILKRRNSWINVLF
jgi:hypothetical protein